MKYKNNPFNIRYTGQQWKGLFGHRNGFCEFESLDYGIRAWLILMRTYRRKYLIDCVDKIVERFAPPSENDSSRYIRSVFAISCLRHDIRLQYNSEYYKLGYAMAKIESGVILTSYDISCVAENFGIDIVS